MKRLALVDGVLVAFGVLVLIASIAVRIRNYNECRAKGLSKTFCSTALR